MPVDRPINISDYYLFTRRY